MVRVSLCHVFSIFLICILTRLLQLTNEFKFPIAAFHHAHETYLVPDLLKKTYGVSISYR